MKYSFLAEGPGAAFTDGSTDGLYGTGGSHGGEAGCPNAQIVAPQAYGSFINPRHFGSGGGNGVNGASTHQGYIIRFITYQPPTKVRS